MGGRFHLTHGTVSCCFSGSTTFGLSRTTSAATVVPTRPGKATIWISMPMTWQSCSKSSIETVQNLRSVGGSPGGGSGGGKRERENYGPAALGALGSPQGLNGVLSCRH